MNRMNLIIHWQMQCWDVINDEEIDYEKLIHHHCEGVDFIPANIELSGLEVSMVNVMSREMDNEVFVRRTDGTI